MTASDHAGELLRTVAAMNGARAGELIVILRASVPEGADHFDYRGNGGGVNQTASRVTGGGPR